MRATFGFLLSCNFHAYVLTSPVFAHDLNIARRQFTAGPDTNLSTSNVTDATNTSSIGFEATTPSEDLDGPFGPPAFKDWKWDNILDGLNQTFAHTRCAQVEQSPGLPYQLQGIVGATLEPNMDLQETKVCFGALKPRSGRSAPISTVVCVFFRAQPDGRDTNPYRKMEDPNHPTQQIKWRTQKTQAQALSIVKSRVSGNPIANVLLGTDLHPVTRVRVAVWFYTYKPVKATGLIRRAYVYPDGSAYEATPNALIPGVGSVAPLNGTDLGVAIY